MQTTLFSVIYYGANSAPLFWDHIMAESYLDACNKAHAALSPGIEDFDIADPEADIEDVSPRRVPNRVTHLKRLVNIAQRKAHPKTKTSAQEAVDVPEAVRASSAPKTLLFDCFVDDEGDAAAYRLSSKTAFVCSLDDTLLTIVAKALQHRLSPRHRHLVGIDLSTGSVVVKFDLGPSTAPTERLQ